MSRADEILSLYQERRKHWEPVHSAMREVRNVYNGTTSILKADMGQEDGNKTPNLLASGVDQMAGRIASVAPMVAFSSENPGNRAADRRASTARKVLMAWWQDDRMSLKRKHRARHLIAYGMSPAVISYDKVAKRPTWTVRNPLECFPSPQTIPGEFTPTDVIFAYERTAGWMKANGYGTQLSYVKGVRPDQIAPDAIVTLLEYIDPDGTLLICTGITAPTDNNIYRAAGTDASTPLEFVRNYSGRMNAVVPTRFTLDRPGGQFDSMVGMYYTQERLMALEVAAVEKGVFPDVYLTSRPNEIGRFIDGPHDGRSGNINIIAGGDIREQGTTPGYMTPQTMDRLERAQRLTGGLPQDFGGESGTNIRTGRRGDAVLSAVIDFPISEAQEVLGYALMDEDRAAIGLAKHYDGSAKRTLYVGTGNQAQSVEYVSKDVFTHDQHVVSYPASGTDLNSLMVGLGQRIGLGIMSKETAGHLDPFIDNPEMEHDRTISEGLEQALMSGIQQQAASGQIPPLTLAKIMSLVKNDKMELADAIGKATADAQKEQAASSQAQPQGPAGPGDPAAPPTPESAGAGPTVAALAGGQPTVAPPAESQVNLASMLTALRKPGRTTVPMANVAQGGQ